VSFRPLGRAGIGGLRMELEEAVAAYRERIKHVLSQHPAATDAWVRETTDALTASIEKDGGDRNHLSRLARAEPST
jgi:hypothetical protein